MLRPRPFRALLVASTLLVASSGPASATVIDVTDAGAGQINVNQGPISSSINATDVVLSFASSSVPGSGSVTFNAPSNSLTINVSTSDANTVRVLSLPAAFLAPDFSINTGGGADSFIINALLAGGAYTIAADGGSDLLDVSGLGLSLVDTGSSILFNGNPIINYSGIETVVGAAAAVAEPLSAALIGLGLAGIGVASRRRVSPG